MQDRHVLTKFNNKKKLNIVIYNNLYSVYY